MEREITQLNDEEPNVWYFTFGIGHEHAKHYVKIIASYNVARSWMVKKYGLKWAFQYAENEYDNCIAAYGYKELDCITEEPIIGDTDNDNIEQDE